MRAKIRTREFRRQLYLFARTILAIVAWLGTIMLANWRYDAFLSALLQAILVAAIVCTGFALFPMRLNDKEDAKKFVRIFNGLSWLFLGVGLITALLYAGIIAISITLY